jgi:ElaA protein
VALRWHEHTFAELSAAQLYELMVVRARVFVVEQNCVYNDADGADPQCRHIWATQDDAIVAYCRVVPPGVKYAEASIGRVLTAPEARGTGAGRELMRRAIAACGSQRIRIGAQAYLTKFYGELGFVVDGEIYDEDGIPHVQMVRA